MAKRSKKGGWTGNTSSSSAVRAGGGYGPQVEKNASELKKYDVKRSLGQKVLRGVLFVLVCVLIGFLLDQAIPKNMAEYWELDGREDTIASVEISLYSENGEKDVQVLTSAEDIEDFCTALDESRLKRLWFADNSEDVPLHFTGLISVYPEGETEPSHEVGFINERVYFIGMPTYDWYLEEAEPIMAYLK